MRYDGMDLIAQAIHYCKRCKIASTVELEIATSDKNGSCQPRLTWESLESLPTGWKRFDGKSHCPSCVSKIEEAMKPIR